MKKLRKRCKNMLFVCFLAVFVGGYLGMPAFAASVVDSPTNTTIDENAAKPNTTVSDGTVADSEDPSSTDASRDDSENPVLTGGASDDPENPAFTGGSSDDPENPAFAGGSPDDPVRADISSDDSDSSVRADITSVDTDVQAEISDETVADDNVVIKQDDKPYLALGADLTNEQKNQVLDLMGIHPDELGNYDLVTVKNEEEHQYLDAYLDSSTIGTRALSSVVIVKRDKGDGIHISTKNISYCTIGMYKNALATAGLEDADVIVAAPFPISGTAALIGAMKAYANMEDTKVDKKSLDAAMNEIVVTGELSENLGDKEQSEQFIAYVKKKVLEDGLDSAKEIQNVISEACDKFEVSLSDENRERIASLMEKIGSLDIDVDSLLEQASSIYDSIADMEEQTGFFAGIIAFFKKIADAILSFIQGIFS